VWPHPGNFFYYFIPLPVNFIALLLLWSLKPDSMTKLLYTTILLASVALYSCEGKEGNPEGIPMSGADTQSVPVQPPIADTQPVPADTGAR